MLVSEYNYEMDMAVQREESRKQGLKEAIKNLMETMNWSLEQAMNALKIPEIERQNYMNALKQK
jgi:hypothetical protein